MKKEDTIRYCINVFEDIIKTSKEAIKIYQSNNPTSKYSKDKIKAFEKKIKEAEDHIKNLKSIS